MKIKIKYMNKEILPLVKIEQGDWIDLRAAEDVIMAAGEFKLIPLGVCMELPPGYEVHIVPRGSTFSKWGVLQTNSMGVVDESYCGDDDEWFFPAYATRSTIIPKHTRLCQFRIMKKMETIEFVQVDTLNNKNRGGFGSTGTK